MDRFNEYWEQLSNKSIPIGKELISYYKTLHENEDGSPLSERCCQFLLQNLLRNPYPTCQLLRLLATSKIPAKNCTLREICDTGMIEFLQGFSEEKVHKLYNLISNNLLSSAAINQLLPVVLQLLEDGRINKELLLLALVSRRSQKLLRHFLKHLEVPPEMAFLLDIIEGKQHFLVKILNGGDVPFQDPFVRNYIRLFQIMTDINSGQVITEVPRELDLPEKSALRVYYLEMKRTQLLHDFFGTQENGLRMQDYAKESSVMALFLKQKLKIEPSSYDRLLEVISENDRINQEIVDTFTIPQDTYIEQPQDYKLLQMLFLWQYAMEMMQLSPTLKTYEPVLESRANSIRNVLKSVEDPRIFVELLESVLTLLFVRYEHLPQKPLGHVGFMCSTTVLETILNTLQLVVTQKNHTANYVNTDDDLKLRLSNCQELINDALWRLSLFKPSPSEETFEHPKLQLTDVDTSNIALKLPDLIPSPEDTEDRVFHSTIDLERSSYGTYPKRRHSKRHSFHRFSQASSSGGVSTGNPKLTMQHSLPLPNKMPTGSVDFSRSRPVPVFSKILGSPEKLATLCVVNKNLETARSIIRNYNLGGSPIGQVLTFLDAFGQIQEKLAALIANYDRMQRRTDDDGDNSSGGSMMDSIRSRTAIGFEASKIISTVENFALSQTIVQTDDERQLLEKYTEQYPMLALFQGESLKNIHAMDLLLGLPMGYDLNLSLYGFVTRGSDGGCSDGYIGFLKRLIDDLQLFRSGTGGRRTDVSFRELLSREVCPLNPEKLTLVLEARKDVGSLKTLDDIRVGSRWKVFGKIQKFVEKVEKLLKLHGSWDSSTTSEDVMRCDLQKVVSELVFEKGVPLSQLGPVVIGANVNLVHVIARNFLQETPGEVSPYNLSDQPEVVEYVAERNQLLGILLKDITHGDGGNWLLKNLKGLPSVAAFERIYGNRCLAALAHDQFSLDLLTSEAIPDGMQRLKMLEAIAERWKYREGDRIRSLRHESVSGLLESSNEEVPLEDIIERTEDVNLQAEYLLKCVDRFKDAHSLVRLIRVVQLSKTESELKPENRESLEQWLQKLQIYIEISQNLENEDWRSVQNLSETNKELILYQLVQKNLYKLCSRWIRIHPLRCDEKDGRLLDVFTLAVMKSSKDNEDCQPLLAIVEGMSPEKVVRFYETILLGVKNEAVIRHTVEYLEKYGENKKTYQKYRISLEIFAHLPSGTSEHLWNLISRPLLIVEQYLMNSRLELLSAVMVSIRPLLTNDVCKICYEQREHIRDLRSRMSGSINLDSSHDDQFISHECIDSLLRIYAGKALDYRISNDSATSGESMHDQSTELSSLDSLCGAFIMPKEVPMKDEWVRDEDASHCMSCRRSVFSMLNRRHHCRRCGRVVCHGCSKKKLEIPELYEDVPVRACDDCVKQSQTRLAVPAQSSSGKPANNADSDEWQLTGNVRNDNIIREEYSYEYAPSTSQCLAICNLHSQNEEMSSFLLYHCAKLESLLRPIHPGYPNPEVDYALVARMLLNLTLAAKVRGLNFAEAEKIKEHAEIILSMVKNDCESLLLQESMSSANLRKLRDALVMSEKWSLALELSLKCGFATSGVMAAWGTTCLRAGCYETAREKFSHCLQKLTTDADNSTILNCIESPETKLASYRTAIPIKRPPRSPPLLLEIVNTLESTAQAQPPEVIARASKIKSSNSSLSSSGRLKNNAPLYEPALNVLNTLANLKNVAQGNFTDYLPERRTLRNKDLKQGATGGVVRSSADYLHALDCIMSTWFFEESMYYLLSYGAHQDVLNFLIKHRQILPALKYVLMQQVDPEIFLQTVMLTYLRSGKLELVIQVMSSMDETLLTWKNYIIYTCRYLETNRMLNCLYNLQLLLRDPIRASMTCVRFYSMDAKKFSDLDANAFHLRNSAAHLQAELELCNWEEINVEGGGDASGTAALDRSETHKSLLMKMEPKELNNHINTILRQLEVAKFLASCEAKGRDAVGMLPKVDELILAEQKTSRKTSSVSSISQLFIETGKIPTLFGSVNEKLQLAVLVLVSGKNIDEGFGLSYRIIQDFNLNSLRVYTLTAKYFVNYTQVEEVERLIQAIVANGATAADTNGFCDELIKNSVELAVSNHGNSSQVKTALEALIKRVEDVGLKIHCYVVTGQLKTAYLLANRYGRLSDIRKILRQSELLHQGHVKRLCEAKLASEGGGGGSGSRKSVG